MKRRIDSVWPAFTDLMTVIAITGLLSAAALAPLAQRGEEAIREEAALAASSPEARIAQLKRELEACRAETAELQEEIEELRARIAVLEEYEDKYRQFEELKVELENCTQEREELAKNEKMFQAIQAAEDIARDFATASGLKMGADQSIQFGKDLVEFARNQDIPVWKPGGQERLSATCRALSSALRKPFAGGAPRARFFTVQIEGHTDDTPCQGSQACNWHMGAARAARFRTLMNDPTLCPGGSTWTIVPVSFAASRPLPGREPTRRIGVRLVPDYEAIIASIQEGGSE